jgi:hypothetical protein
MATDGNLATVPGSSRPRVYDLATARQRRGATSLGGSRSRLVAPEPPPSTPLTQRDPILAELLRVAAENEQLRRQVAAALAANAGAARVRAEQVRALKTLVGALKATRDEASRAEREAWARRAE